MAQAVNAFIQCARGAIVPLQQMMEPHNAAYCKQNGLIYVLTYGERCPKISHHFEKIFAIREWCATAPEGSYACYADGDVILTGKDSMVAALGDCDIGLTKCHGGAYTGGVIMFRNNPSMREFWDKVVEMGDHGKTCVHWGQYEEYNINALIARGFPVKVKHLNSRWNFWARSAGQIEPPIQIYGYHAISLSQKFIHMKNQLRALNKWQPQA